MGCALTVLLEYPEYEKFIGIVLLLKRTYFGKVDFKNTFLIDFCLLLYISGYSGETVEECNLMIIEIWKNSDGVSDNDYFSDSKTQIHLNFQKKNDISVIEKHSTVVVPLGARCPFSQFLEQFFKRTKNFDSFCIF